MIWDKIKTAKKFEENGLLGLKASSGEIVLKPEYDHIECCADFVYAHYENRHKFLYKDGGVSDGPDREDDYRFYENGHIGLKRADGSIFLSSEYDEIIDWGTDCDVVYVRKEEEYHYFNHNREEILTDVEILSGDAYPLIPYNLGEDQNRNVIICVEPIMKREGNSDCYAYGQWVRLSRIPCFEIRKMFSDCRVVNVEADAVNHFEDKYTYIYSARVCTMRGDAPISACIDKFKTMGCYDSSWDYLIKISANSKTQINPYDLYNAVKHFEDLDSCISFNIAIDHDDSLEKGVVKVFQLHYFWDDMGAFLNDRFKQQILPSVLLSISSRPTSKTSRIRPFW